MTRNENINTIVLNTPKNLDLKLFFPEYNQKDIYKIMFLINQINHFSSGKGYQVNIRNHAYMLSMRTDEITSILSTLVSAGIIKITEKYQVGSKSNTYKMVNPFTPTKENGTVFYDDNSKFPLFLKKFIADGKIVKSKKDSAFKKVKFNSSSDAALLKRIAELEAENTELKKQVAALTTPTMEPNDIIQPEVVEIKTEAPEVEYEDMGDMLVATINNSTVVINDIQQVKEQIGDEGDMTSLVKQLLVPDGFKDDFPVFVGNKVLRFIIQVDGNERMCVYNAA